MRSKKILICDDERDILRYLKKLLEGHGMEVETFTEGAKLLSYVGAGGTGDILLQDVSMPDLDGFQVMSRVRKLRPDLPVVVMTAYVCNASAVAAAAGGASGYLAKPFPRETVLSLLQEELS